MAEKMKTINDYKQDFIRLVQEVEKDLGCKVNEVRINGRWNEVEIYNVPEKYATPANIEVRRVYEYDVRIEF